MRDATKNGNGLNIAAPFIRRPIATSLLTLALLMAGVLAYTRLPVAPLPQFEYPVVSVQAGLPGASPETMASSVAASASSRRPSSPSIFAKLWKDIASSGKKTSGCTEALLSLAKPRLLTRDLR